MTELEYIQVSNLDKLRMAEKILAEVYAQDIKRHGISEPDKSAIVRKIWAAIDRLEKMIVTETEE